ncbi:hypothetical protein GCM10011573_22140 [Enterococcus wangshanyuanii]|uniref:Uncharacterized protein n=1 Tax=Enterococcus wangshanyuanii TaxID=2005703 RepID=A0ABQ1PA18_9ENTE|nr:hypothetical protein GCM10011573_22140 [Enterococcus wangshanyuanii]
MHKQDRKNYLVVITVYILVRLIVLIRDNNLSLSYFLNYELSGVIGFVIGYTLLYYIVLKKDK